MASKKKPAFKFDKPAPPGIDSHRDPGDSFKTNGPVPKGKGHKEEHKEEHPIGSVKRKVKDGKVAANRKKRNKGRH